MVKPIEQQIESVVDSILQDYRNDRDVDKMDLLRHPDKDIIIDIIEKLRRIIFPGYARDNGAEVEWFAYDRVGHGCWNRAYEQTDLIVWLAAQKRISG